MTGQSRVTHTPEMYFEQVQSAAMRVARLTMRGGSYTYKHAAVLTQVTELYRLIAEFSQVKQEDRLDHVGQESQEMSWINRQDWHRLVRSIAAIHTRLDAIETKQQEILMKVNEAQDQADRILAGVAEEKTEIASFGVILDNMNAEIKSLKDAAVNMDLPQPFVDRLAALEANTGENRAAVIEAVKKGTPSQPQPVPTPTQPDPVPPVPEPPAGG